MIADLLNEKTINLQVNCNWNPCLKRKIHCERYDINFPENRHKNDRRNAAGEAVIVTIFRFILSILLFHGVVFHLNGQIVSGKLLDGTMRKKRAMSINIISGGNIL